MDNYFVTGSFKLHDPSARKRQMLDHVFCEYTLANQRLLDYCRDNEELLKEQGRVISRKGEVLDRYTAVSLTSLIRRANVDADISITLKDSLQKDIASGMASYLMLLGDDDNTGFPIGRDPSPEGYPNALENFVRVGSDLDDYNTSKALLLKRAKGSVVPVTFSRYRDCRILMDIKKERVFALMSLLPGKHPLNQKTTIQDGNLIDINTGEIFSYRGSRGVLFPLEVGIRNGRWHWQYERFLKPVMDGLAFVKTGKLVRKEVDGAYEYFLQLSFGFPAPEPYEPETYLGIDMGILFTMAYALIDTDGRILFKNHEPDGYRELQHKIGMGIAAKQKAGRQVTYRDFRTKQKEEVLHILINNIIDVALKHRAGIVIEELNVRVRGRWVKSAWKKIAAFLKEKCKRNGIPFREVFAYNSSRICIHCGELVERDDRVVTCPACGAVEHSDSAAGVNVARRAMYRKKEWVDKGGYRAFHRSFANVPVLATKTDLRQKAVVLGQLALL